MRQQGNELNSKELTSRKSKSLNPIGSKITVASFSLARFYTTVNFSKQSCIGKSQTFKVVILRKLPFYLSHCLEKIQRAVAPRHILRKAEAIGSGAWAQHLNAATHTC